MNQLNESWPNLILLDWILPGSSGVQFVKHLEHESMTQDIPAVTLTTRGEEEDRARGLETDADNYTTKPPSPKEPVTRIKAVMRCISPMAMEEIIEVQELSPDPTSHRVMTDEEPLETGPTEFKLLCFFMTHPEHAHSREQLLNHIWRTNVYVEDRTVDVHIHHLRKALEPDGHDCMVQAMRGTGYRFSTRFQGLAHRTQSRACGFLTGVSYVLERLLWKRLVLELLFCYLPAFILGAFFGYLPWFLLASVTELLVQHFRSLLRLSWWLWVGHSMTPSPECGSWEPLLYGPHQMQLQDKKRRRRLGNLIKRFRSGAKSLPDAVVLTMEEGGIFWCSGLTQQILGLRRPGDNGQNVLNLLRYPEFAQYLKTRDFSCPPSLVLNIGRHLEIRVMPHTHKQLLMVTRDATQMHQLEGARRNSLADVSHELCTPLTVLQGYPEMMDEQSLEGAVREKALHTMHEQTQRMKRLVKQLLTLSKIEAAPTHLLNEEVDVPMMLHVVGREAQALSQKKQASTLEVDNGLKMSGNEGQLHNAILSLVYNAASHTPEGTHITVRWQRVPHGAEFSAEGNGPGIASEHIPRLTECFYRVNKARPRQTDGSGLGLAIVKHAMNHHKSCLNIKSTVGRGTRFSFVIPERSIAENSD